jgi:hypothetical protein
MLAHPLIRTRYSYSLTVIISHPKEHKEGLGYLSVCAIASRSSPPSPCVFVTVIQARSYVASIVAINTRNSFVSFSAPVTSLSLLN